MNRKSFIAWCRHACTLQNILVSVFPVSLLALLFFLFLYPTDPNDLGWHLKYGEYFVQHGQILKANIFSYTMPDFVWINHSWFYDVLTYVLFQRFSFIGLSVVGALLGVILTLILYLIYKPRKETFLLAFIPFYLVVGTVFSHGFRAQTISLVFLSLTMWLVKRINKIDYEKERFIPIDSRLRQLYVLSGMTKYLFASFLLFVLWANCHGGYMSGLTFIGLSFIGLSIDEYSLNKKLTAYKIFIPILLIGFLGGLITPFGLANYIQSLEHVFSNRLSGIYEWMPWPINSWQWWLVMTYIVILIWQMIKNTKLRNFYIALPIIAFSIQALLHRRMQGTLAVISFPVLLVWIENYHFVWKKKLILTLAGLGLVIFISWNIAKNHRPWLRSWNDYCQSQWTMICSNQLLDFLKNYPVEGKIFNQYDLGGFLIWNYPQQKVYIDGRIVAWQEAQTKYLPYQEYENIMRADEEGIKTFKTKNFDFVVIPKNTLLAKALFEQLAWQVIYQDEKAVIMQKPD